MMINELFHFVIRFSGFSFIVRNIVARNNVSILLYHNPDAQIFESHIKYLFGRFNFISLSDLGNAIVTHNWESIPHYAMIITFDDGWKENHSLLNTIIKYKLKPTIFLTSHLINTKRNFWWTICNEKDSVRFKQIPNKQRLLELKERYNYDPYKEYQGRRQSLNIEEINDMKEFVEFGLHSSFHPVLTKCTEEEKRKEIHEGKKRLENILNKRIVSFAYPNGDFDDECIEILKESGIEVAKTANVGWNNKKTNPFKLRSMYITDNASINKLVSQLTGISFLIYKVFYKSIS
jgi:peptidoglycan/xylan/chitin deacetylase (PgdA/CDA1 family)